MEQIPNSVEDTVSKLKTVGQNYKKIFSVIGIIILITRNSNLDENYYDSNGNLIYQQLFLNGSDHVTCFDSNGYEISLKDFYNSIISDYVNEQVVSYYFNDKLSKME